jgi:hydroxymethylglutaryl-CoA lyase
MMLPKKVQIVEVGPRDGLQNEKRIRTIDERVALIDALSQAGLTHIEVGSFVRSDLVPAMADTDKVFSRIQKKPGVRYTCLVPNEKGLDAALACGVQSIAVFTAASETFNQKNINMTIAQSLERIRATVKRAKDVGQWVRGYISTAWYCPYEGKIAADKVVDMALALQETGCDELSIGDTIGHAEPAEVKPLLEQLLASILVRNIAVHFHDTKGHALENIQESLKLGISIVDSSIGGLGGCPFAPGAKGNVATEKVVTMLDGMGIQAGVDEAKLLSVVSAIPSNPMQK